MSKARVLRGLFCAFIGGLCVGHGASAGATPAVEAQFFDERGRRAYAERRFEQALESFLLVQSIAPSPRALYNVALCAEQAGKRDLAFTNYGEYLTSGDSDPDRRSDAQARLLLLEREIALLLVASDPPGARIYIDRKELGEYGVTPRVITVASGEHSVLLELEGYRSLATPVWAEVGSRRDVSAALEPVWGQLSVDLRPATASLELRRGELVVPARVQQGMYQLPVGDYVVLATAPGYVALRVPQIVREGEPQRLSLELRALPRPSGRLLVASGGVAADVLLDGRRVAVTPATLPDVSAGTHHVQVRAGSRSAERSIVVAAGRATFVELPIEPENR
jgi:hypothetical protein